MQLRADEAAVVEKAVRLAIESVMNVLCAVNSARTHELQRLVADRERQIRSLEDRVRETEAELRLLLRPSSPPEVPEQRSGVEPESGAGQTDCEVRVSLALLTGPPSDAPDGAELDQSGSSSAQSVSEAALCPAEAYVLPAPPCPAEEGRVREPPRPTERRVKQERLYPGPGHIKLEPLSPDCGPPQQTEDGPVVLRTTTAEASPRGQGVLGPAELWPGASSQAELSAPLPDTAPGPQTAPQIVPQIAPWRSRTTMSRRDQSEEAMRRRRASWRAASRRYYARKMARLQNHSTNHSTRLQPHGPGLQPHGPSLQPHGPSLQPLSSCPGPGPQYPSCSGASESWRFSVCDVAPLHHQPTPSSSEVTFMTESDLLNSSLS